MTNQKEMNDARGMYYIAPVTIGEHFGIEEEGGCLTCGEPLQVHDKGFEIRCSTYHTTVDFAFCSRKCARERVEELAAQLCEA